MPPVGRIQLSSRNCHQTMRYPVIRLWIQSPRGAWGRGGLICVPFPWSCNNSEQWIFAATWITVYVWTSTRNIVLFPPSWVCSPAILKQDYHKMLPYILCYLILSFYSEFFPRFCCFSILELWSLNFLRLFWYLASSSLLHWNKIRSQWKILTNCYDSTTCNRYLWTGKEKIKTPETKCTKPILYCGKNCTP